jgi:dihydroxy-acid dehydratase
LHLLGGAGRCRHVGNAQDTADRIDRDDLDVIAEDILVLMNIGPKGAPGMPEVAIFRCRANSRALA